jgi:hypothetical protein
VLQKKKKKECIRLDWGYSWVVDQYK